MGDCQYLLDLRHFVLGKGDVREDSKSDRDQDDSGGAIDAAGELPGGKHFSAPKELKVIIAGRQEDLSRNLMQKLLSYALCRQLEGYDEIVVDRLMESVARDGYRMQTLISEIVTSYPFCHRSVREPLTASSNAK